MARPVRHPAAAATKNRKYFTSFSSATTKKAKYCKISIAGVIIFIFNMMMKPTRLGDFFSPNLMPTTMYQLSHWVNQSNQKSDHLYFTM